MAYDPADGVVLDVVPTSYLSWGELLTWEYSSNVWTNVTSEGPEPTLAYYSWGLGLAWDPVDAELVLFGHNSTPTSSSTTMGTWVFHGGVWKDLSPAVQPEVEAFGTSTDTHDGGVLVFGTSSSVRGPNSTWLFHGGAWHQQPSTLLPAQNDPSLNGWLPPWTVDDPAAGYVLALGNVAWSFANGVWTNRSSISLPYPWYSMVDDPATYDPALHAVVVYSEAGDGGAWAVVNGTWNEIGGTSLDSLLFSTMVYDAHDGYLLALGPSILCQGTVKAPACPQEGTWKIDATPVDSSVVLLLHASPQNLTLGESFTLWANATGAYGVDVVTVSTTNGDCQVPYNLTEYSCQPSVTGVEIFLGLAIDQAGQRSLAELVVNVTAPSSPSSSAGLSEMVLLDATVVAAAAVVVVAVLLLFHRRKRRKAVPAAATTPPATWA